MFFLTGSPPRIASPPVLGRASLPALLLAILLYAGTLRDTAAIVPTDAVARSCRLVKLVLFILIPFTLSSQCRLSVPIYLSVNCTGPAAGGELEYLENARLNMESATVRRYVGLKSAAAVLTILLCSHFFCPAGQAALKGGCAKVNITPPPGDSAYRFVWQTKRRYSR